MFCGGVWWVNKRVNLVAAVIVATLLNGVVCAFTVLPIGGMGMVISMLLPLIVGSAVNIIIAAVAYKIVKDSDMI